MMRFNSYHGFQGQGSNWEGRKRIGFNGQVLTVVTTGPKAVVYEEELYKTQEKGNGGLKKLFGALVRKKEKGREGRVIR